MTHNQSSKDEEKAAYCLKAHKDCMNPSQCFCNCHKSIMPNLSTCFCVDIDFQTYDHVVGMKKPFKEGWDREIIPIDVCIATEIAELWHRGVITLNSCCGHRKVSSSVITPESEIEKMKELGYNDYYLAPSGLPCFKLKTGTALKQLGDEDDRTK